MNKKNFDESPPLGSGLSDMILSINKLEDNKYYIYDGISFYTEEDLINHKRSERLNYILNDTEYKEKLTVEVVLPSRLSLQKNRYTDETN